MFCIAHMKVLNILHITYEATQCYALVPAYVLCLELSTFLCILHIISMPNIEFIDICYA
jgi:hypothetical protein